MAGRVKKFAAEIDADLYREMVRVAKQNRQSQRYILERALEFYLHEIVSSQRIVRPDVMEAYRRSTEKHSELYQKLANR